MGKKRTARAVETNEQTEIAPLRLARSTEEMCQRLEGAAGDLAMYAAILGHRPTIEPPQQESVDGTLVEPAPPTVREVIGVVQRLRIADLHWPGGEERRRISDWVRRFSHHLSQQARQQLLRAKTRLATREQHQSSAHSEAA